MPTVPNAIIGGAVPDSCASQTNANNLAQCYGNLLSGAAGLLTGSNGQKILVLQAGDIVQASATQTGSGNAAETSAEAANNQLLLNNIAAYCRANGIGVMVEADLTDTSNAYGPGTDAIVANWANAAARAGLPIVSVEDVQEVGTNPDLGAKDYAQLAANEVLAIKTLISNYATVSTSYKLTAANLAVGDMEGVPYGGVSGPGDMHEMTAWWQAYDAAAAAAGLQKLSYVTTDTLWQAPWISQLSSSSWVSYLEGISAAAKSSGMSLNVDIQGISTAATDAQFISQMEEDAAWLATLQGTGAITVSNLAYVTWQWLPSAIGMISSPSSMTNAAAEIAATYPLYETGLITAQTIVSTSAAGQMLLQPGVAKALAPISITWDPASLKAGSHLAVVLIDQTGLFSAIQHGSGTVGGSGTNILVLSGNYTDLSAELASVRITEPYSGPDTIDIEVFGANGQLSDNRISVLALQSGQTQFATVNSAQGWATASAIVNSGNVMVSQTLTWNTTGISLNQAPGKSPSQPSFVNTIAVHEPLAEFGIQFVGTLNGMAINAAIDIAKPLIINGVTIASPNSAANNSAQKVLPGSSWVTGNFNPDQMVAYETIASTTNTFDPSTGLLIRSVDTLLPDPKTLDSLQATTVTDPYGQEFSNGGTRVILYNTGNNPGWYAGWGNQFSSVTLIYDGAGQLVERQFQGGPANPSFTIDQVLDPNSGKVWEEFQSAPPPPSSTYAGGVPGFATGGMYVTEFNTGNNPNWDYLDWGTTSPANTELDTTYYTLQDVAGFILSGAPYCYPCQFVNGTTLDLIGLPGTISVNLSATAVVVDSMSLPATLSGINCIDAANATGLVTLVGAPRGGSTLIGGDYLTSIDGFGGDTIVAGSGTTSITNFGKPSNITLAGAGAIVTIAGNGNTINAVAAGDNITIIGSNNTITAAAGASVTSNLGGATLTAIGSGFIIKDSLAGTVTATGNNETVSFSSSGTFIAGSATTSAILSANLATLSIRNAGGTITIAGNGNVINASGPGTIAFSGLWGTLNAASIAVALGAGTASLTINGDGNTITAGTKGNGVTINGSGSVTVVPSVTVTETAANKSLNVIGNGASITAAAASDVITLAGSLNVVKVTADHVTVSDGGSRNTFVSLMGNYGQANLGNSGTLSVVGAGCLATLQQRCSIRISGAGDSITAGALSVASVSGAGDTLTVGTGSIISITSQATAYNINIASGNVMIANSISGTVTGAAKLTCNGNVPTVSLDPHATMTVSTSSAAATLALTSAGTIDLTSGTLKIQGPISSGATFKLDGTATLELASMASSGASMQFIHQGTTLRTDSVGSLGATISGFAHNDTIDVAAVLYGAQPALHVTSDGRSYADLVVSDSKHDSSSFTLLGAFNAASFHLLSDNHGGIQITYTG